MNQTTNQSYSGDKIQNYFTAYVEKALKNNRVSYFRRYKAHLKKELLYYSEDQIATLIDLHSDVSDDSAEKNHLHLDSIQMPELAKELRNLPDKSLTIIRMRIIHGYSHKIIGSILGMSEEAVRVRYFRAIQKIRDNMKEEQK